MSRMSLGMEATQLSNLHLSLSSICVLRISSASVHVRLDDLSAGARRTRLPLEERATSQRMISHPVTSF